MTNRLLIGKQAEHYALRFLIDQGLHPVARNWHSRYGEIDLIMRDHATLVFIEVRYRKNIAFARPVESITRPKQQKIIATAHIFLQQHSEWQNHDCRFDVIGASGNQDNYQFHWIKHAFEAG